MAKKKSLPELRLVRANGGFKIHLLPKGKYTSLCGHTPQNNNRRMKRRGKWLLHDEEAELKCCEKCSKEAEKRGQ